MSGTSRAAAHATETAVKVRTGSALRQRGNTVRRRSGRNDCLIASSVPRADARGFRKDRLEVRKDGKVTAPYLARRAVVMAGHLGDVSLLRRVFHAPLGDVDGPTRASALSGLARQSQLHPADLGAALEDDDGPVQRMGLALAATPKMMNPIKGAEPPPPTADDIRFDAALLRLLRRSDNTLAEAAAWALGERHTLPDDADADRPELVAIVTELADVAGQHPDAMCREAAVAALGSIGHPLGRPAAVAAMTDKATVRRRAVIALAAFDGPDVDLALSKATLDRDWQVRQAAEDLSG